MPRKKTHTAQFSLKIRPADLERLREAAEQLCEGNLSQFLVESALMRYDRALEPDTQRV